jgi:hypothetical protein
MTRILRRWPSPAMIVALMALFVALRSAARPERDSLTLITP